MTAYKGVTDYGSCCLIVPYLYLVNPETRKVDPLQLDYNLFHEIPKGVENGMQNGLTLVLDVESFDHAYFTRSAKGFMIALTNALDKPVINLGGQYVAPGKFEYEPLRVSNKYWINLSSHSSLAKMSYLSELSELSYSLKTTETSPNIKSR